MEAGAAIREQRPELRERIIDATVRVVRERGMARTRTSTIASEAGCAEGSIYRYFSGKAELLLEAVRSRLAASTAVMVRLPGRAGTATVRTNLLDVVRFALSSCREVVPLAAGVFADSELLAEQRHLFIAGDRGLLSGAEALAAYLRAEQKLGRVQAAADADLMAQLLVNGCRGEGFLGVLLDRESSEAERERYACALVDTVLGPAAPGELR